MSDVRNNEMIAYDSLPPQVRDIIKDTNYNPIDAYFICQSNSLEKAIILIKGEIDEWNSRKL